MSDAPVLEIRDLHVSIGDEEILRGIDLNLAEGEINALMGRNGSGKSTLALVIMGPPAYEVTKGEILLDGENLLVLSRTTVLGVSAPFIQRLTRTRPRRRVPFVPVSTGCPRPAGGQLPAQVGQGAEG